MTARRIRWIVTDLDGTLVGPDLRIVPRSAAALAAFRRSGGQVILATGRNEVSAGRYHAELGLHTPVIVYNGARVVDLESGNLLYAKDIGPLYVPLRDLALNRLPEQVGAVAFVGGEPVIVHDAPALAEYARRDGLRLRRAEGVDELVGVVKVLLVNDRPELAGLARLVAAACPELVTVSSEPTYLEVLPPAVSKGAALRWLAARCGVDPAEVAAIGDNPNDADMLVAAGLGAAPADAHLDVRAVADVVLGRCVEGAVADLVELVLDRNGSGAGSTATAVPGPGAATYARNDPAGRESR